MVAEPDENATGALSLTPNEMDLLLAVKINRTQDVIAALGRGVNPNIRDRYGYTLLMIAASKGFTPIVEILIRGGADIHARCEGVDTALVIARDRRWPNIYELLIANGADASQAPRYNSECVLACPCCGFVTISDEYDICEICWWEHDLVQLSNPDELGANGEMTLRMAQKAFAEGKDTRGREMDRDHVARIGYFYKKGEARNIPEVGQT